MTERVQVGGLQVAKVLYDFVNNEAIPGTGINAEAFWAGADSVIHDLAPKNRALLAKRDDLQEQIDAWHQALAGQRLFYATWVVWVEFILMLAGVLLTVFAPLFPTIGEDFRHRPEAPALDDQSLRAILREEVEAALERRTGKEQDPQ